MHDIEDTAKCVKRILKFTQNKKKEIEEMLAQMVSKAEANSVKFLEDCGQAQKPNKRKVKAAAKKKQKED